MTHDLPPDLVRAVQQNASEWPDYVAFRYLDDAGREEDSLTFGQLDQQARAIGALLSERAHRGDRALILFAPGLDFVRAFFGCLYSGVIAVPAYPPAGGALTQALSSIVQASRPRLALTSADLAPLVRDALGEVDGLTIVVLDEHSGLAPEGFEPPAPDPDRIAFLQFTSGSTGAPRGVVVTHRNVAHNQEVIYRAFRFQSGCGAGVLWLPMYHDMGLIGGVVVPAQRRLTCVFMSPFTFLKRPLTWLEAISRYQATCAGGPNFAFQLCIDKTSAEQREQLDLSSWEVAFCGAEQVRPDTMRAFARAFAPAGFRSDALMPVYGLAETTLAASGYPGARDLKTYLADASALEAHQVRPGVEGSRATEIVSCGVALGGQRLSIVDPLTCRELGERQIGEIWLSGPSVADGYWGPETRHRERFTVHTQDGAGPFLRTDDLGFLHGGELYVTGRRRDVVIIRGRNLYPQDIEQTVTARVPGLRPGCGAAFAVDTGSTEGLVVVQEVSVPGLSGEELDQLIVAVRRAIGSEHDVVPSAVTLLAPRTIPKTSSGKLRRAQCRADFLAGRLQPLRAWADGSLQPPQAGAAGGARHLPAQHDVLDWLLGTVSGRAGVRVRAGQSLSDAGLGSLDAADLGQQLEQWLGAPVPIDATWLRTPLSTLAARICDHRYAGAGRGAYLDSIPQFFGGKAAASLDGSQA